MKCSALIDKIHSRGDKLRTAADNYARRLA